MQHANAFEEARRGTYNPTYLYYTLGKLEIYKLREDYKRAKGVRVLTREVPRAIREARQHSDQDYSAYPAAWRYRGRSSDGHRPSIFSTYFARMSHSMFTLSPGLCVRSAVASQVCGIMVTDTTRSATAATVRLMPSIAIEPLYTT